MHLLESTIQQCWHPFMHCVWLHLHVLLRNECHEWWHGFALLHTASVRAWVLSLDSWMHRLPLGSADTSLLRSRLRARHVLWLVVPFGSLDAFLLTQACVTFYVLWLVLPFGCLDAFLLAKVCGHDMWYGTGAGACNLQH